MSSSSPSSPFLEALTHAAGGNANSLRRVLTLRDMSVFLDSGLLSWVVLDMSQRPVNVLNESLSQQAEQLVRYLQQSIANKETRAVIFVSGKRRTFIAGADITTMYPNTDAEAARSGSARLQAIFNRIESLRVPTVAAIDGPCLGGGLEWALACQWRVASGGKWVQIGLPEVKLGLLPGGGGCVRLPRLIGLTKALELILAGAPVRPHKAKKLGIVDAVFADADTDVKFLSQTRQFAARLIDSKPRVLVSPLRRPGLSVQERLLNGTRIGREIVARMASKNLDKLTGGNYPAPYQALAAASQACNLTSQKAALALESDGFARLAVTPQSKALMSLFFLTEQAKKGPAFVQKFKKHAKKGPAITKIGVIGAGVMGAQIALLAINKGFSVFMRDIKESLVEKGLRFIDNALAERVDRGRMTRDEAARRRALVSASTDIAGFASCELLIEAAVERMDLKMKILKEIESVMSPDAIFATNTSSLSITELASVARRPQRIVGMHFFNPVGKMPLVEVIRGAKTDDAAAAQVYLAAGRLGKVPIVCGDAPGFIVNRILGIYMKEAGRCLLEGAGIDAVDDALVEFGMPMGPIRLMDEVGLDVAGHVSEILEALGDRFGVIPAFHKLLQANAAQLGKKTGAGFYLYDAKGKQGDINTEFAEVLEELQAAAPKRPTMRSPEIQDRCVLVMLNEAAHILDEGIVSRPEDLDLAMVMGTGFAPFRGGLLNYADQRGLSEIVSRMEELAVRQGAVFEPHAMLRKMAERNQRFFPNRPRAKDLTPITANPRSRL